MIEIVVSGGQTGADTGGLKGAKNANIPTSGYAPLGWRREGGPAPWLGSEFGLIEADSSDWDDRTRQNVRISHVTLIIGRRSQGSNLTERICQEICRPYRWVWWGKESHERPKHPLIAQAAKLAALAQGPASYHPERGG